MPYSLNAGGSEMISVQLILIVLSPGIKNFGSKFLLINLYRNFKVLMSSLKWFKSIHIPLVKCQTLSEAPNFINDICKILKFGVTIAIKLRIFYHCGE